MHTKSSKQFQEPKLSLNAKDASNRVINIKLHQLKRDGTQQQLTNKSETQTNFFDNFD